MPDCFPWELPPHFPAGVDYGRSVFCVARVLFPKVDDSYSVPTKTFTASEGRVDKANLLFCYIFPTHPGYVLSNCSPHSILYWNIYVKEDQYLKRLSLKLCSLTNATLTNNHATLTNASGCEQYLQSYVVTASTPPHHWFPLCLDRSLASRDYWLYISWSGHRNLKKSQSHTTLGSMTYIYPHFI